ncbi:hypothetical protein [Streptomyces sp. H27-C3]|uniref:hypothetical protein n=1 Tax=Streptomyces sp. H27-C3 TaxID=3046305 RepID=UPI0024B8C7BE|nr:hypothetical protein [Streptomyces sp. H27-C3]MDJ0463176.1 hypothetical protein [Streptomyces sp. H27-C3]
MSKLASALVAPGQVWADADSRRRGRTVRVERAEEHRVHVLVLTNSHTTQNAVDAGSRHLDQRGLTSSILRKRFSSDCYTLLRPPTTAVSRMPGTCIDLQKHDWQPAFVMAPSTRAAHAVLVCRKCSAHTTRRSPYVPGAALEGDLAA